jgi:hypothetical protein
MTFTIPGPLPCEIVSGGMPRFFLSAQAGGLVTVSGSGKTSKLPGLPMRGVMVLFTHAEPKSPMAFLEGSHCGSFGLN